MFFGSRTPLNRNAQLRGDCAKVFQRPAFIAITRERVNDGEGSNRLGGHCDPRDAFDGRRQRREKREGQMADGLAEVWAVRSVPGIDGVEGFEVRNASAVDDAE